MVTSTNLFRFSDPDAIAISPPERKHEWTSMISGAAKGIDCLPSDALSGTSPGSPGGQTTGMP